TRQQLERGRRVREVLKQDEHDLVPVIEQIAVLFAATTGLLDAVDADHIRDAQAVIRRRAREQLSGLATRIAEGARIDDEARGTLTSTAKAALKSHDLI
ncbi:MAG: F0F1 ATP synthase subunit alpha, partial [bacterium]